MMSNLHLFRTFPFSVVYFSYHRIAQRGRRGLFEHDLVTLSARKLAEYPWLPHLTKMCFTVFTERFCVYAGCVVRPVCIPLTKKHSQHVLDER